MQLKQYPEYKTCNYPNVDNIPSHWNFDRNKYVFNISKEVVGDTASQHDLLSLTLRGIIKRDLENPTGKFPAEFNTYQKVRPNDLVFCLFDIDETPRTVGISSLEGMITGAYTVVKCKPNVNPQFLYYYYLALDNHKKLKPFYTGLRKVIKPDIFLRIRTPYPTKSEQDQIVKYLDFKSAKITKFIRNKRRLIQLLNEQKQAIINQAVTRGINPDAQMKPSGIDWLGNFPEHWERQKITHIFKNIGSGTTPESGNSKFYGGDVPWIITGDLNDGRLYDSSRKITEAACQKYTTLKRYPQHSLVVAMYGATIGKVSLIEFSSCVNQACCVLSNPAKFLDMEYMLLLFIGIKPILVSMGYGGGQPNISQDVIKSLRLPIPPIEEQHKIAVYVNKSIRNIDLAIEKATKEIQLIQEYRTRLISDVVTGKVDVRDIKIEDVIDEEITDDLDSSEDEQEQGDSVEEVLDEE
jgi:type I restriction enzyme, S subunit